MRTWTSGRGQRRHFVNLFYRIIVLNNKSNQADAFKNILKQWNPWQFSLSAPSLFSDSLCEKNMFPPTKFLLACCRPTHKHKSSFTWPLVHCPFVWWLLFYNIGPFHCHCLRIFYVLIGRKAFARHCCYYSKSLSYDCSVGRGGALVESIAFNQRVVGSTPALVQCRDLGQDLNSQLPVALRRETPAQ